MSSQRIKQNFLYSANGLKLDFDNFINFLKDNKLTVNLCWFFLLLSYGIKLFWYSIGIDTECIINNYEGLKYGWFSINRSGLILTKTILKLVPFNPYIANFLMLCTMFFFLVLLGFLFYSISEKFGNKPKALFILPCVFITHPLFAEQFNFTLQAFEVSFAIALMFLSVFFITKWVFNFKNTLHLLMGTFSLAWAFASYQAIVFLYITVILAVCMFVYTNNLKNQLKEFNPNFFRKTVTKYLITFCVSYAFYVAVSKLICFMFKLKSEYTNNMICWGKDSFWNNVKCIRYYVKVTLTGNAFYSKVFILLLLVAIIYFFKFLFFKNHTNKVLYVISFLALIGSPYFLCIILARPPAMRMQFSYQFLIAFILFFVIQQINLQNFKNRFTRAVVLAFSLYLSFFQSYKVASLMYTDYMKYQSELALAGKISERIDNLNLNIKTIPAVFVGNLHLRTPCAIQGDVIGYSFFEWDSSVLGGVSGRALGFMKTIGYSYKGPTEGECIRAEKIAKTMPCWPNPGAVKYEDGVIVVKLSNN